MQTTKVVILEGSIDFCNKLNEYFSHQQSFSICGSTDDGEKGIEIIKSTAPDVVLVSLVLKGIDGFEVMDRIKRLSIRTKIIVMGVFVDENIVNNAMKRGASYYLAKPFTPDILVTRINDILCSKELPQNTMSVFKEKKSNFCLDEKISTIFISIGIPPHIKGYTYLREGIKMAVHQPQIINNVTKELYPKIGEKFQTSASKVERAIRHAIEVAWNKGRVDVINSLFGVRVYMGSEKPTNSEFIALLADKLILESIMAS